MMGAMKKYKGYFMVHTGNVWQRLAIKSTTTHAALAVEVSYVTKILRI
jgi:hypothetical protein